ncbi:MAG: peptide ABC transporter substrate-binding protein [Ardenticatenales bacterium]|nr:peptide ABC transporter substrate-binding protein [Ardenticatenales bacterium]
MNKLLAVSYQRLVIGLGLIMGLLLACSLSGQLPDSAGGNQVTISAGQPRTLDPALTLGGPDSPIGHIFSGLVTLDTHLQVQPDLAAGWEISPDGTVYTFYLRRDVLFHDGSPFTAADVIFSWERATDPALGSDTAGTYLNDIVGANDRLAGASSAIAGLRAIDDYTLEVTIDAPKVYFLAKLTYPVAYVVQRENVAGNNWEHAAIGTGPFKLERWTDDQEIILTRNVDFYGDSGNVDRVVYLIGQGIPLAMYEQDEIDLVGLGGANLARALDPNEPFSADLATGVDMCTTTLTFDTTLPPFDDARVRQAFNYAIDKQKLIATLYDGNALPAHGALPPGMPGYNDTLTGYPYNPDQARSLLAEAGYADGAGFPVVSFYTSGYTDVGGLVEAVISMWQETLGVSIQATLLDPFIYYDELYAGNHGQIFSTGWCADYPDPQNFLDILYGTGSNQNLGGYSNPEVDGLLAQAQGEPVPATRLSIYAEAEAQIVTDAPVLFLVHSQSAVLVKPRLQGYVLTPIGVPQWHRVNVAE